MITINGVRIEGSAHSIVVSNNRVIINGSDVTPDAKDIRITVTGNVESIQADVCTAVYVTGDVGSVSTMSGNADVRRDITGSVKTMSGNVSCEGSIKGAVRSMSGDVTRG